MYHNFKALDQYYWAASILIPNQQYTLRKTEMIQISFLFQSKRKGLSVEEKRQRMMEFFFEKVCIQFFFNCSLYLWFSIVDYDTRNECFMVNAGKLFETHLKIATLNNLQWNMYVFVQSSSKQVKCYVITRTNIFVNWINYCYIRSKGVIDCNTLFPPDL